MELFYIFHYSYINLHYSPTFNIIFSRNVYNFMKPHENRLIIYRTPGKEKVIENNKNSIHVTECVRLV